MTRVQTHQTLGDLVTSIPSSARILDRAGLDYCCRGRRTLSEACEEADLDPDAIAAQINDLDHGDTPDWQSLSPELLAEHIVATHHAYLREFPLITALAARVHDVHGVRHPELAEVSALIDELRADLEPHLDKEERVLFPAIRAVLDAGRWEFPFGRLANPMRVMMAEHDRAGELLAALSLATHRYHTPSDGCASYRSLYDRLAALEHDTHVHIHRKNHVLFPAAIQASDNAAHTSPQEVSTHE